MVHKIEIIIINNKYVWKIKNNECQLNFFTSYFYWASESQPVVQTAVLRWNVLIVCVCVWSAAAAAVCVHRPSRTTKWHSAQIPPASEVLTGHWLLEEDDALLVTCAWLTARGCELSPAEKQHPYVCYIEWSVIINNHVPIPVLSLLICIFISVFLKTILVTPCCFYFYICLLVFLFVVWTLEYI